MPHKDWKSSICKIRFHRFFLRGLTEFFWHNSVLVDFSRLWQKQQVDLTKYLRWCGKEKKLLSPKNISSNQLFSKFISWNSRNLPKLRIFRGIKVTLVCKNAENITVKINYIRALKKFREINLVGKSCSKVVSRDNFQI